MGWCSTDPHGCIWTTEQLTSRESQQGFFPHGLPVIILLTSIFCGSARSWCLASLLKTPVARLRYGRSGWENGGRIFSPQHSRRLLRGFYVLPISWSSFLGFAPSFTDRQRDLWPPQDPNPSRECRKFLICCLWSMSPNISIYPEFRPMHGRFDICGPRCRTGSCDRYSYLYSICWNAHHDARKAVRSIYGLLSNRQLNCRSCRYRGYM